MPLCDIGPDAATYVRRRATWQATRFREGNPDGWRAVLDDDQEHELQRMWCMALSSS